MNKNYLIFDVDNTILEKQAIDDKAYKLVSSKYLSKTIEMLKHPETGKPDTIFSGKSHDEIWKYKLEQAHIINININFLVAETGIQTYKFLKDNPSKLNDIKLYLNSSQIREISTLVDKIGIATSGLEVSQEYVLEQLGYFRAGISRDLASYSENENSKDKIIMNSINKYTTKQGTPEKIIFVDDSPNAITQFKNLKLESELIGVAVQTGNLKEFPAADIIIPSLKENFTQFYNYLESLK